MTPEKLDQIIGKIDHAIGPPQAESPEDHAKRQEYLERQARAREIRKSRGGMA